MLCNKEVQQRYNTQQQKSAGIVKKELMIDRRLPFVKNICKTYLSLKDINTRNGTRFHNLMKLN